MTRPQLRYLVAHENLHKALHHCTAYNDLCEKYPELSGMAMDYVINLMIEDMGLKRQFVARPESVPPLVDEKYRGMSWIEVMRNLMQQQKQQSSGSGGSGGGAGSGRQLDEHRQRKAEKLSAQDVEKLKQAIEDAVNQGQIVQRKLRGDGAGGADLSGFQDRRTDWRTPLRRFIQDISEGDDQSRFCPPNKRMLPLGILMPSHFTEAVGEIIVACDTSGSMGGVYSTVFGEIARICQQVRPSSVRVLWWDTRVAGEQVFTAQDYDKLKDVLQPKGGGGTTVSCVAQHIRAKKYKPKAVIMLTDGHIESTYETPDVPCLWGVVDNARFVPRKGKAVHINSLSP
jgi:predicted metal-dependent peptidase